MVEMSMGWQGVGRQGLKLLAQASLVAGAVGGMLAGQPSVGLLAGLGVGLLAAILLAVRDRR